MDYISSRLNNKIRNANLKGNHSEELIYQRVRMEYLLLVLLGYYWNKNFENLSQEDKSYAIKVIKLLQFGSLERLLAEVLLDDNTSISKVFNKLLTNNGCEKYSTIRNDNLAHGYVFDDGAPVISNDLNNLYESYVRNFPIELNQDIVTVIITGKAGNNYQAINYSSMTPHGAFSEIPCGFIAKQEEFFPQLYWRINNEYIRLSPFIKMTESEEVYFYSKAVDLNTAQFRFNQVFSTDDETFFIEEFRDLGVFRDDDKKIKRNTSNKCEMNIFECNYGDTDKFIETATTKNIDRRLRDFIGKPSNTCITIVGQGGTGKTACVQKLCSDLFKCTDDKRKFQHIVFITAKNRVFNAINQNAENIINNVNSYDAVMEEIRDILGITPEGGETIEKKIKDLLYEKSHAYENIENQNKLLLVIDDFETFDDENKKRIIEFINEHLDILIARVIITTRYKENIYGANIDCNKLEEEDTLSYLTETIKKLDIRVDWAIKKIENDYESAKAIVFASTIGNPMLIKGYAYSLVHEYSEQLPDKRLMENDSVFDFIYGKTYNGLSEDTKKVFICISKICDFVKEGDYYFFYKKTLNELLREKIDESNLKNALEELSERDIIEVGQQGLYRVKEKPLMDLMNKCFDEYSNEDLKKGINEYHRIKKGVEDKLPHISLSRRIGNTEDAIKYCHDILNCNYKTVEIIDTQQNVFIKLLDILKEDREQFIKTWEEFIEKIDLTIANREKVIYMLWAIDKTYTCKYIEHFFAGNKGFRKSKEPGFSAFCAMCRLSYVYDTVNFDKNVKQIEEILNVYGNWLYDFIIKHDDISQLDYSVKNNIKDALYKAALVNEKLNCFDRSREIAEGVIEKFNNNYYTRDFKVLLEDERKAIIAAKNKIKYGQLHDAVITRKENDKVVALIDGMHEVSIGKDYIPLNGNETFENICNIGDEVKVFIGSDGKNTQSFGGILIPNTNISNLNVGDIKYGLITSITGFGDVFVDIGIGHEGRIRKGNVTNSKLVVSKKSFVEVSVQEIGVNNKFPEKKFMTYVLNRVIIRRGN
ncbi:MAG: AAA family ATPase [Oscillospiraceae bacterium]|nr:AAA family ATPase [Oscillospiraceae bacterium]